MSRKVCIITGTRAEYGLLRWIMQGIEDDINLTLQIIVTGMHLSKEFGLTFKEIEKDGFQINRKIPILNNSDSSVEITKSMGIAMSGFAAALKELKPDLILVLGDRFEMLSAASAALVFRIPVAHIHGGEASEGVIDEAIRHSITKMSHFHFVAAEEYRRRVIQLGEQPENVFLVGGLGVDNINHLKLLNRTELEDSLNFKLGSKNLLITFHPVTLEFDTAKKQMNELLMSLEKLEDTKLIFTLPNADTGGRELIRIVERFVSKNSNACAYKSLGQLRYFSCINHVDGVVGNSSSGLLEAPSFKKGSINIGDRQRGRLQADSVINCDPNFQSISNGLKKLYSQEFQKKLTHVVNPYGEGGATKMIISKIKNISLDGILKKRFYDLDLSC